jgi:hypothetical protein
VTWHKPFCVDLTTLTLEVLRKMLQTLSDEDSEDKTLLKNVLKILSSHLGLLSNASQQSPLMPDISSEEKRELERLLYRLLDSPSCPQDIVLAVGNCLYEGMNLLLPPLPQRITIANDLLQLKPDAIKKSQRISLRLILQSINDPKAIGLLVQSCQHQEGLIKDVVTLLETLLCKESQFLADTLNNLTCEQTRQGSPNEERGLLFAIHTQFILFNLGLLHQEKVYF